VRREKTHKWILHRTPAGGVSEGAPNWSKTLSTFHTKKVVDPTPLPAKMVKEKNRKGLALCEAVPPRLLARSRTTARVIDTCSAAESLSEGGSEGLGSPVCELQRRTLQDSAKTCPKWIGPGLGVGPLRGGVGDVLGKGRGLSLGGCVIFHGTPPGRSCENIKRVAAC